MELNEAMISNVCKAVALHTLLALNKVCKASDPCANRAEWENIVIQKREDGCWAMFSVVVVEYCPHCGRKLED